MTCLRSAGRGSVHVELDGRPWRRIPVAAAAAAGVLEGVELDRERARNLARALRKARALDAATRMLRVRDLPVTALGERLARAGHAPAARADALDVLEQAGLVDDDRYARSRADALAERGYGDAAIRADLQRRGVPAEQVAAALAAVEPEASRAARLVERRGSGAATARFLARRGFGDDAVVAVAGAEDWPAVG